MQRRDGVLFIGSLLAGVAVFHTGITPLTLLVAAPVAAAGWLVWRRLGSRCLLLFTLALAGGVGAGGAINVAQRSDVVATHPPVILLTFESVRADHVGPCYNYSRATAPDICSLAENGVLFENAYSQGTRTPVSIPVLLTGRSPRTVSLEGWNYSMPRSYATIPDVLTDAGYRSGAGIHPPQWNVYSFLDDFVELNTTEFRPSFARPDRFTWYFYREWGHEPYTPPERHRRWDNLSVSSEELRQRADAGVQARNLSQTQLEALYDAEIRASDEMIESFLDDLREHGRYEDTLIIVTSDHGERFDPEKRRRLGPHGGMPSEAVSRVPLLIKFPGNRWAGRRVETPVRLMDIAPTLYDYLDILAPEMDGRSFLPLLEKGDRVLRLSGGYDEPVFSAGSAHTEWALFRPGGTYQLRNVESACTADESPVHGVVPGEAQVDVNESFRTLCMVFRRSDPHAGRPFSPSGELQQRLRDLGYRE